MSYFQVDSTAAATSIAKAQNGIIEIENTPFSKGTISLIRDPQGAGFTIYEGYELHFEESKKYDSIIETELHVSDLDKVLPFYSKVLNWEYEKINDNSYQVKSNKAKSNIKINQLSNDIKGKYEYWVITIRVEDLKAKTKLILENGGSIVSEEGDRILMSDNSGEAFFYIKEGI